MQTFELKVDDKMLNSIAEDEDLRAMEVPQAFLRAMKFLLRLKKEQKIDEQLERAYSDPRVREALAREVEEWQDEQVWID